MAEPGRYGWDGLDDDERLFVVPLGFIRLNVGDCAAEAFRSTHLDVDDNLDLSTDEIVKALRDCLCVTPPPSLRARIIFTIKRQQMGPHGD
ncbi:hypothetical protein [Actinomyces minihominis]|uniref:hypothetical protein n=1 Tax=Actinomyces minihominis TaxID=2002838 RepID=UPI000C0876CC|nr:hypothetical protein [Actinomyces minihominis]